MDDIVAALGWATNNLGARSVVNMSYAGPDQSAVEANAIAAAWAAGNVLVAGAGNDQTNTRDYPAAYDNVIGVSGIKSDATFASQNTTPAVCAGTYSNYGDHVDLTAPFEVLTRDIGGGYISRCGTSYSTPHVSGVAVLVRALHPDWSNTYTRDNILFTAEHVAPGGAYDTHFGYGIPRADLAVGLYRVVVDGSLASGSPRLTWDAVPLAHQYTIYRRVWVNGVSGGDEQYGSTFSTSWTDSMQASSGGSCNWGSGTVVVYWVNAMTVNGVQGPQGNYWCFVPSGPIPQ